MFSFGLRGFDKDFIVHLEHDAAHQTGLFEGRIEANNAI